MKKIYFSLVGILILALASCIKRAPDPNDMEYYKNKIIKLRIDNVDFGAGDFASLKIGTAKVDANSPVKPRFAVNGEPISGDFFVVGNSMIADGPVFIETLDSAWQLIIEYNLKADASKYYLTLTPTFNDVAAEPVLFDVRSTKSHSGILEIKEYRNE